MLYHVFSVCLDFTLVPLIYRSLLLFFLLALFSSTRLHTHFQISAFLHPFFHTYLFFTFVLICVVLSRNRGLG